MPKPDLSSVRNVPEVLNCSSISTRASTQNPTCCFIGPSVCGGNTLISSWAWSIVTTNNGLFCLYFLHKPFFLGDARTNFDSCLQFGYI